MIEFRLSVDVLGNTRFAFSPLAEVASSIRLLGRPRLTHLHRPWLADAREKLGEVDMALLSAVAPPGRWAPDFLYPPAPSPSTTIEDQLHALARTPVHQVREELEQVWDGRPAPPAAVPAMRDDLGPGRLADAIWTYWQAAVHPYWSRICGVLEDDVSYRAAQSLSGGLFDLLADLHPEVSLDGDLLFVDKPHHADASYAGAQLTLVPSVFAWPDLVLTHSRRACFELTYAARGVGRVWEGIHGFEDDADALAALVGRTRASILRHLAVPSSTTQLARDLGQSPSAVSQHLSVLKGSGLLTSWRTGRHVLYRQTPMATTVVAACDNRQTRRSGA